MPILRMSHVFKNLPSDDLFGSASFDGGQGRKGRPKDFDKNRPKGIDFAGNGCVVGTVGGAVGGAIAGAAGSYI